MSSRKIQSLSQQALLSLAVGIAVSGCSGDDAGTTSSSSTATGSTPAVTGKVYGGQQPITGSTVTLYAAGTSNGTASTTFTPISTTTDANGAWNIAFTCQTGDTNLYYLTAGRGNAGGGANTAIGEMAVLGTCANFPSSINIDEVTTISAVATLSANLDTATATQLGSTSATALANGIAAANAKSSLATGTSKSSFGLRLNQNTLADVIAACINSASNGFSECQNLFTATTPASGTAPTTTLVAALDIALNPTSNTTTLFNTVGPNSPFQPVLTSAPTTFALVPTLATSVDAGLAAAKSTINQGTAIGQGSGNGATPFTLNDLQAPGSNPTNSSPYTSPVTDSNNTETITSAMNPFNSTGNVPDTAYGFCNYSGSTPTRVSYVSGATFATTGPAGSGGTADNSVAMAPFYFPLVYNSAVTTTGNVTYGGGKTPIIGLFDWRPKDIDEALVAAESDDNGKTWYFMQTVLELFPDYTNPASGGYGGAQTSTGCPTSAQSTNASNSGPGIPTANGNVADDGWGHAAIVQLPGLTGKAGQFLYLLDRGAGIDVNQLFVINLASPTGGTNGGVSNKFPIWNTNNTGAGANDIKSISTALSNSSGAAAAHNTVAVKQTAGLMNPDGIMAVFPTATGAAAGSTVTVMYVQKILNGDKTGSTALPASQQCNAAPFSKKTNHDISNVRLATTTDGINFTDIGIVQGLNDPTTVDYNGTRWVAPRGTLIDVNGDGSLWGLYFSAGNCLDGDSDAFHFLGYAESSDKVHWTVYNDINSPIASINTITTTNQLDGSTVTVPANAPAFATQPWFAQRLYAPTAVRVDATHLALTFAGYGVQTPSADYLNYRQIGNVVLTLNKSLAAGTPNNINAH